MILVCGFLTSTEGSVIALFKKTFQPFSSSLVSDRRLALFLLVPLDLHKPIVNLLSPDEGLLWFA